MDPSSLRVLQAASEVLNNQRPVRDQVEVLTHYAKENMPERLGLPADELATLVALKLMDVPGDL